MDEDSTKLFASLIVALFIFAIANISGIFYQDIANFCYQSLQNAGLEIFNPPQISNTVLKTSLIDLILSPSEFLQSINCIINIFSTLSLNNVFQSLQLLGEVISLFNIFLTLRNKELNFAIISISIGLAYFQVLLLLIEYLVNLIMACLNLIP